MSLRRDKVYFLFPKAEFDALTDDNKNCVLNRTSSNIDNLPLKTIGSVDYYAFESTRSLAISCDIIQKYRFYLQCEIYDLIQEG